MCACMCCVLYVQLMYIAITDMVVVVCREPEKSVYTTKEWSRDQMQSIGGELVHHSDRTHILFP